MEVRFLLNPIYIKSKKNRTDNVLYAVALNPTFRFYEKAKNIRKICFWIYHKKPI